MAYKTNKIFYQEIEKELNENEGIHLELNHSGFLHIERNLPFLMVYRPEELDVKDTVIENLLKNEASYLILKRDAHSSYITLLKKLIQKLSDQFGAFLILEIWTGEIQY